MKKLLKLSIFLTLVFTFILNPKYISAQGLILRFEKVINTESYFNKETIFIEQDFENLHPLAFCSIDFIDEDVFFHLHKPKITYNKKDPLLIDTISSSSFSYVFDSGITLEEIKNNFIRGYVNDREYYEVYDYFNDTNSRYFLGLVWHIKSLPNNQYPYLVFTEIYDKRRLTSIYKISKVILPDKKNNSSPEI